MPAFARAAVLLSVCAAAALADRYAVLVAGSKDFANYRHQADVAHAYQVLVQGGVPAENIITMMYDDAAHCAQNPYKGTLYNHPSKTKGWDVYQGLHIDYKGDNVTAANFLAVLTGDSATTRNKVLQSTGDDTVFVYFADHGAPGLVAMPAGPVLHADDLMAALKTMHTKQMYKQLVFYMEACESGSMFQDLPKDINIYAMTAANAAESSQGTYCPPDDQVGFFSLGTCLGDTFSVSWMEDADATNLDVETLAQQHVKVRNETKQSHVMQFGQLAITAEHTSVYEGHGRVHNYTAPDARARGSQADSRDIALLTAYYAYLRAAPAARSAAAAALVAEIQSRERADDFFASVERAVPVSRRVVSQAHLQPQCYKPVYEAVRQCGMLTDYSLKHVATLKALCDSTDGDSAAILSAVRTLC